MKTKAAREFYRIAEISQLLEFCGFKIAGKGRFIETRHIITHLVVHTTKWVNNWGMFERCLYFNLNALTRRINRIWDDAFANMDISPAHAYLLRLVLNKPGLSPKQIGGAMKLKKSTVSRFIDGLEDKGFVVRKKGGEHDSRLIAIYPTRQASATHDKLEQQEEKLYQSLCVRLGEQRVHEIVRISKQALDKL